MATHFSILAWEIPWTEEAGGLQFTRSQESDTTSRRNLLELNKRRLSQLVGGTASHHYPLRSYCHVNLQIVKPAGTNLEPCTPHLARLPAPLKSWSWHHPASIDLTPSPAPGTSLEFSGRTHECSLSLWIEATVVGGVRRLAGEFWLCLFLLV